MIKSFADATTSDIFHGLNTKEARKIPVNLHGIVRRKLDMLNAAMSLDDLRSPGNHLEKLTGKYSGFWSIRVNDQYRIIFQWANGDAHAVKCFDYH